MSVTTIIRTEDTTQTADNATVTAEPVITPAPVEVEPTQKVDEDQITKNFHFSELIHSITAVNRNMRNTPTDKHRANLIQSTKELFQPVRDILGKAVLINSGYRSETVNRAVGGSRTSAHKFGFAIDFISPSYGSPRQIAECLVKELPKRGIKFDQLILEFPNSASGGWIHLGFKNHDGRQRGQILTAKKVRGKTQYFSGLV